MCAECVLQTAVLQQSLCVTYSSSNCKMDNLSLWNPSISACRAIVKAIHFDYVEIQNLKHDVSPDNVLEFSFYFTKNTLPLLCKHRSVNLTLRRLMSYIYMEHPFLMFLDHTQRRSTVGRTPLDE